MESNYVEHTKDYQLKRCFIPGLYS